MSATPSLTSVRQAIDELDDLSDTQTIRLLERHSPYREGSREADVDEAIRVIKPEDTQSMLAIKQRRQAQRAGVVRRAARLVGHAFDMAKVPPLAIFNAYTLYTTEANREGRTWYGLRLGFFSDAVSAKQVAYYVRSDFKTVSVVPVTTIEKERATDLNAVAQRHLPRREHQGSAGADARVHRGRPTSGVFKLLEDDTPDAHRTGRGRRDVAALQQARARAPAAAAEAARRRSTGRARSRQDGRAKSRKPRRQGHAGAMRTPRSTKRRSTRRWRSSAPTRSRSPTTAPTTPACVTCA